MAEQDHSYKLLFRHPRMVRDLLEGFVSGEWVGQLDFETLERVSDSRVSDDLRARANDIVWRVRCGEHAIYLLFEFQSDVERFMAVRVLTYVGLLYQDLIRASGSRGIDRLPAILPIVLHSGAKRWRAAEDLASLVREVPPDLETYVPQARFLLIDECRFDDAELASQRNFAAMLFRLENCYDHVHLRALVNTLGEWLRSPDQPSLRRAFAVWLQKVVLKRVTEEQASSVANLLEKPNMLSEQVERWERILEQKGVEKGLVQGAALLLTRQLKARFHELPDSIVARIGTASSGQLELWGERLLSADSLQQIFEAQ